MTTKISFTLLLACILVQVKAQFNFSQINNQHAHNLASAQLPSLLGNDLRTGEIQLVNLYAGFGNSFISAYDIQQLTNSGKLTNEYIDNFLKKTPNQATVWAGADVPLFNIFFNVNKKAREPFLSFGIGARQKIDFNFNLNKDLLSLIYKGNKQFAGKSVNLSPSLNMLYYNEYFFAVAGQFKVPDFGIFKTISVKPAARFRLLNGMASIYMPDAQINMYTEPDGRYIDLTTSLTANMSASVDTPDVETALGDDLGLQSLQRSGRGMGMDLGVGVSVLDRFKVHLGVIDIGSINFTRNVVNYTKNATYTYDGIDLNEKGEAIGLGGFEDLIQPDKTYKSYKMPLPTRLVLSGFYQMGKKTRRKVTYYRHNASFTYVQGFSNYLSATKRPALNLGYSYSVANFVNTGLNFTLGGLNKVMGGGHLSFRLGAVKLAFASNNLLPIFSARAGRGTDFNLFLGFYF
jgi:hypothetical protein